MYTKHSQRVLKAAVVSALALAVSFSATGSAYALDVTESSVINSGDNAHVMTDTHSSLDVMVNNTNSATINQSADITNNTGYNTVDGNIGGASSIMTGPAWTNVGFMADANRNTTSLAGLGANGGSDHVVDVVNTGDGAHVESNASHDKVIDINSTNTANFTQNLWANNNTGHNMLDGNLQTTGGAGSTLRTGEAQTAFEFGAAANANTTALDLGSGSSVYGTESSLTNTGDDTHLMVDSDSSSTVNLFSDNVATLNQNVNAQNQTGYNGLGGNIGGSGLMTGRAAFGGEMGAAFNQNTTALGAGWGLPAFFNVGDVVNTGDDTQTHSTVNHDFSLTEMSTNTLWQSQSQTVTNDSGHNDVDDSIGGGMTSTGQSVGTVDFEAEGNHNTSGFGNLGNLLSLLLLGSR